MVQSEIFVCVFLLSMAPVLDACFAAGIGGCCGPPPPAPGQFLKKNYQYFIL